MTRSMLAIVVCGWMVGCSDGAPVGSVGPGTGEDASQGSSEPGDPPVGTDPGGVDDPSTGGADDPVVDDTVVDDPDPADTSEDPGTEDPVSDPPGQKTWTCTPVGDSYGDGFFSLRAWAGKLYAGQFGYGHENQSMLYRYPDWELVSPGLLGISESVCAMREFQGQLYANTESSGDIFRSTDGANWQLVYDGDPGSIGCGLEAFEGHLYAVNYSFPNKDHGRILRSADGAGWSVVWDSGDASSYVREITSHDGTLYAFFVDESGGQGHVLTSTNGTDWLSTPSQARFFRGHSWKGSLWASSTEKYSNGVAGIWRFGGAVPKLVYQSGQRYVTELVDWQGSLFAATSNGWKQDVGTSSLLVSHDGETFETICDFPELAAWSIAVHDDKLYVGTWQYGSGGRVYEVEVGTAPPDDPDPGPGPQPPLDCSAISANASWEVCETGATHCAGVFTDGAGCTAYCAAAGLVCTARFGGEPGCQKEPQNVLTCGANNGHQSDWCVCGTPSGPPINPDPDPDPDPDPEPETVDCSPISANPAWEVCESSATHCGGVFTNGSGCASYCAAAGLVCTARYGGEPGCLKEPWNVWDCNANNGHQSDYCVCGVPGDPGGGGGGTLDCDTDSGQPQVQKEKGFEKAVYSQRHNWVLGCYPNAYTAGADEHKACDPEYNPDGSRKGKATFTFASVGPGAYDVYVCGRHTNNRNPAGALFVVNGQSKLIQQKDGSGDYIWDYHGQHCLSGPVTVVLDSTVNSGSDSVCGARLVPAP